MPSAVLPRNYPLSPMQAGMLYQYLLTEGQQQTAGFDIEQVHIQLDEQLDVAAFQSAWNAVLRHYPVLASRFRWRQLRRPQQFVVYALQMPVQELDWRNQLIEEPIEELRREFLRADRNRGFDLNDPPLMRITLARTDERRCEVIWTFHHILLDGRSLARVLADVFAVYEAMLVGKPVELMDQAHHFAEYLSWHERLDHQSSLNYFKQLLAGKTSPTPLPLAEPANRPLPDTGYGRQSAQLDVALHEQLRALARHHDTTMSGIMQVAWALLLMRLTGDDDVVFGITRSCRYSALQGDATDVVGLFINTLPARIRVNEDALLGTVLHAAREQWIAMRDHDQTPLVDIQAQSDMGPRVALFETLLMYDNRELNSTLRAMNDAWSTRQCTLHEQPSTPLALTIYDDQVLEMNLLYDRHRYADQAIARMLSYLSTILTTLAQAEQVSQVQILDAVQQQQIVHEWNDTAQSYADHLLIQQLFEQRVASQPQAIALEAGDQRLTYAELDQRANQLAHVLRHRGVVPGKFVGICLSRDADLVIAMLAVVKAGGAYVPVDPEYPIDRIEFMLQDANVRCVITNAANAPHDAPWASRPLVQVQDDEVKRAPVESLIDSLAPSATSNDACYAIYTSGSTGKPKGVVLTHRAVVNTVDWVSRTFNVQPGDRALFVTSPCFDLSVYDVFGILGAGATVVMASNAELKEPQLLVNKLVKQRITIWDSAPAALQRLVSLLPTQGGHQLRLVMLSGDWIPLTLPDAIRQCFPAAQVMNLGGATEAAIWSNWYAIGKIDPRWNSIPYGTPIQNSQYYVLDKRRQPVPPGVTGDLYIAGVPLAQGYLNREELTAERFLVNPFRQHERMYMTGDLARYFDDGVIEFLGRADFQVKIRGYRVELGEIEAALIAQPGVAVAVCLAYTEVSGAKALVAYLCPRKDERLEVEAIKAALAKSLPDFMVPARFIVLDAMPVTANGKLDRNALPSPHQHGEADDHFTAPRTRAEMKMAVIWRRLLKVERVGVDDNFFALGGDSLLAVSLAVQIEKKFKITCPLSTIMVHPTLGEMTAAFTAGANLHPHLVTLSQGVAGEPPLFLFSGGGGFGFFYQNIAEQLQGIQSVHVLNAIGADNAAEINGQSVEEMAAVYEPQIMAMAGDGPVLLGGYSFGAMLAFEVAKRLQRRGKQVPWIISFDGPAPGHPRKLPLIPRLMRHVHDWATMDCQGRRAYLAERWGNLVARFQPPENHPSLLATAPVDPQRDRHLRKMAANLAQARRRYKPQSKISSRVLLFKAEVPLQWPGHDTEFDYGWTSCTQRAPTIIPIPGDHQQFFSPTNNEQMVAELRLRVERLKSEG